MDDPGPHILLIGVGNTLRRDDGVGRRLADAMERAQRPGLRVLSVHQLLPEHAAALAEADAVLFVDADADSNSSRATVTVVGPRPGVAGALAHAMGPSHLLALAEALYGRRPAAWQVAIPARDFAPGEGLSLVAGRGLGDAREVVEELIRWLAAREPGAAGPCRAKTSAPRPSPNRSAPMPPRIIQVDAFTNRPFAGNPAAVCLLDAPAPDAWMQRVAAEMNLSETAFVHPLAGQAAFGLRWFTPAVEVDLCGHATLATAHALWEEGRLDPCRAAAFETRSGRLTATRRGDWIELDFPEEPARAEVRDPAELDRIAAALGRPVVSAWRNRLDLLVELGDEAAVRSLRPDVGRIAADPARGVIATSRSADPGFDFVSRFFAPRVGVDEDPVCGSAHCFLGPFWAARLGRDELTGRQVSCRGGVVKVRVGRGRVALIGQAVTVLRGELCG